MVGYRVGDGGDFPSVELEFGFLPTFESEPQLHSFSQVLQPPSSFELQLLIGVLLLPSDGASTQSNARI
jgi:hypothetical protein